MMYSALMGAAFGGLQLWLLTIGVTSVTRGKMKLWALLLQFFCPMAGLLLCAFLWREHLVACAVGMCAVLVMGAIAILSVRALKKNRPREDREKV